MKTLLEKVKSSLRITTNQFDEELGGLIQAGLTDLSSVGVCNPNDEFKPFTKDNADELITVAVTTYVKLHFGHCENYDRLKQSYDEQKAQLKSCSKYTNFGVNNG